MEHPDSLRPTVINTIKRLASIYSIRLLYFINHYKILKKTDGYYFLGDHKFHVVIPLYEVYFHVTWRKQILACFSVNPTIVILYEKRMSWSNKFGGGWVTAVRLLLRRGAFYVIGQISWPNWVRRKMGIGKANAIHQSSQYLVGMLPQYKILSRAFFKNSFRILSQLIH